MSAGTRRVTEPLLEFYLVGSLDAEARAQVEAVLAESEADRARLAELRAESAAFLLHHPPGPLVARFESAPRRWWRNPLVLYAPALALVVLVLFVLADEPNRTEARAQQLAAEANAAEALRQQKLAEDNAAEALRQKEAAEASAAEALRLQKVAEANVAEALRQQQVAQANATEALRQKEAAEASAAEALRQKEAAEANAAEALRLQKVAEANAAEALRQKEAAEASAAAARAQQEGTARAPRSPDKASTPPVTVAKAVSSKITRDDLDGDGISNIHDKCPRVSGDPARAGCPRTDTDSDGIEDSLDACSTDPGDAPRQGCPVRDQDSDGVEDELDSCQTKPGPAENRGCPLKDRDKDGIENDQDECPDEPGPLERLGCPEEDADKDGVPNRVDTCAQQSGAEANLGCPEHEVPLVAISPRELELRNGGKVYFEASQARIQQRSFEVLDWVAKVLREHPEIPRVVVGAHTDDRGFADQNRQLSQQRAEEVRRYLIDKGVAARRLEARGFGSERPLDSNATSIGRENNRRVDFKIILDSEAGSPVP